MSDAADGGGDYGNGADMEQGKIAYNIYIYIIIPGRL